MQLYTKNSLQVKSNYLNTKFLFILNQESIISFCCCCVFFLVASTVYSKHITKRNLLVGKILIREWSLVITANQTLRINILHNNIIIHVAKVNFFLVLHACVKIKSSFQQVTNFSSPPLNNNNNEMSWIFTKTIGSRAEVFYYRMRELTDSKSFLSFCQIMI